MRPDHVVIKYGGSVLSGEAGFLRAARDLKRHVHARRRLIAVVSAGRGQTERLLTRARGLSGRPPISDLVSLLAIGEAEAARLLSIAVSATGLSSCCVGIVRPVIRIRGRRMDGRPDDIDIDRLLDASEAYDVVIVPGFVARTRSGAPALLGRGGGDLTALAISAALRPGRTDLVKDVDGIFDRPPDQSGANRYDRLGWSSVADLESPVVQTKAARFAMEHRVPFRVRSFSGRGTWIGPDLDAGSVRSPPTSG